MAPLQSASGCAADASDHGRRRLLRAVLAGAAVVPVGWTGHARAQAWPARPIRFISATAPGGSIDVTARAYGDHIARRTGGTVLVESRPGGQSMIAADLVARSPADGHTWLFVVNSALTQAPILLRQVAVPQPEKAFDMLAGFSPGPALFMVRGGLPARTVREFVELGRRQRLVIGSIGVGSRAHLVGAQMNKLLGMQIDVVHYKGAGPAMQDLAGGQVDCGVSSYTAAIPYMQGGRMRPIAIVSGARSPKLPDVPTFADEGYTQPAFRLRDWLTLCAPAGTPRAILQQMADLIREGTSLPEVQRARDASAVTEAPLLLDEFEKALAEERPVWQSATRELGVKLE